MSEIEQKLNEQFEKERLNLAVIGHILELNKLFQKYGCHEQVIVTKEYLAEHPQYKTKFVNAYLQHLLNFEQAKINRRKIKHILWVTAFLFSAAELEQSTQEYLNNLHEMLCSPGYTDLFQYNGRSYNYLPDLQKIIGPNHFKAWVNRVSSKDNTLLLKAIHIGDKALISKLLQLGAEVTSEALTAAAKLLDANIEHVLTQVNLRNRSPETLKHNANIIQEYLNNSILKLLLDHNPNSVNIENSSGYTLLDNCLIAFEKAHVKGDDWLKNYCLAHIKFHLQYNVDLERNKNSSGRTPLLMAACMGSKELVQTLVEAGANTENIASQNFNHLNVNAYFNSVSEKKRQEYRQKAERKKQNAEKNKHPKQASSAQSQEFVASSSSHAAQQILADHNDIPRNYSTEGFNSLETLVAAIITSHQTPKEKLTTLTSLRKLHQQVFPNHKIDLTKFMAQEELKGALRALVMEALQEDYNGQNLTVNTLLDWLGFDGQIRFEEPITVAECNELQKYRSFPEFDKVLRRTFTDEVRYKLLFEKEPGKNMLDILVYDGEVESFIKSFPKDIQANVATSLLLKKVARLEALYFDYEHYPENSLFSLKQGKTYIVDCLNYGADVNQSVVIDPKKNAANYSNAPAESYETSLLEIVSRHHDVAFLTELFKHPNFPTVLPETFTLESLLKERQQLRDEEFIKARLGKDHHLVQIKLLCDKYPALLSLPFGDEQLTAREWADRYKDTNLSAYITSKIGPTKASAAREKESAEIEKTPVGKGKAPADSKKAEAKKALEESNTVLGKSPFEYAYDRVTGTFRKMRETLTAKNQATSARQSERAQGYSAPRDDAQYLGYPPVEMQPIPQTTDAQHGKPETDEQRREREADEQRQKQEANKQRLEREAREWMEGAAAREAEREQKETDSWSSAPTTTESAPGDSQPSVAAGSSSSSVASRTVEISEQAAATALAASSEDKTENKTIRRNTSELQALVDLHFLAPAPQNKPSSVANAPASTSQSSSTPTLTNKVAEASNS